MYAIRSYYENKGVQPVLNAVVDYLPDPTEVTPQPEVDLEGNETGAFAIVDPDRPLRALAFKIMDDRYGALTFTRIYSGVLRKGDSVLNTFTGKTERIGRIVEMHADSREEKESAQAGDIVAGLISAFTIRKETQPEFELNWVQVEVPYLGAAPQEVEEGVVIKIEEAIQSYNFV